MNTTESSESVLNFHTTKVKVFQHQFTAPPFSINVRERLNSLTGTNVIIYPNWAHLTFALFILECKLQQKFRISILRGL